jgi:hypothetical protein
VVEARGNVMGRRRVVPGGQHRVPTSPPSSVSVGAKADEMETLITSPAPSRAAGRKAIELKLRAAAVGLCCWMGFWALRLGRLALVLVDLRSRLAASDPQPQRLHFPLSPESRRQPGSCVPAAGIHGGAVRPAPLHLLALRGNQLLPFYTPQAGTIFVKGKWSGMQPNFWTCPVCAAGGVRGGG